MLKGRLEATAAPLVRVAFSGDGRRLAAADEKGIIHVLGAAAGTPESSIPSGSTAPLHVEFTQDDAVLVVDAGGNAVAWDAETPWKLAGTIGSPVVDSSPPSVAGAATPPPFTGRVTALAFSPDGSLLATGDGEPSRSGHLKVWKLADRSLLWSVDDAHSDTLSDIQFSYDGRFVATAGTDKFVRIFSAEDGRLVRSLEGHTGHVLGVGWQADGKTLASCGADNVIKVWDVEKGEQRQTIGGYGKQVTAVSFVGIGGETISCSGDRTVRRHQAADRKQIRTFDGASDFIHCLSITPAGGIIAAGDENGVVRVWSVSDGKQLLVLEPPKAE
jgi:WD40 repeat protein